MDLKQRLALLGALADVIVGDEVVGYGECLAADVETPEGGGMPYLTLTFEKQVIRVDANLWTVLVP